ncbi:DUF4150 domain-containing protein [Myxococcus sp. AM011]|uniref:DUF4150 domain-containing protein n=1 Tax=Myxococcus sp. AM011 TaxID=2745200 RepID=UPI0015959046|nr:DUF4150 domain-containing protein [Myxococcus sp. AM011]NVJ25671.1 DUF4150 domain-containing protein [Myxococcus sp. AM011]
MSGKVFANGMEISSKSSGNKSIAAMPDVCMSPPPPPAGPVPIPYPNTATTSDTTDGSKSVQIEGKEVHLKNKSSYKTSNGNQPATNNFGANVITHKITGAMKFAAWSFNVKVEGQNVVRFMDLTTHNHANTGGGAVTSSIAALKMAQEAKTDEVTCEQLEAANQKTREEKKAPSEGQLTDGDVVTQGIFTNPDGRREVVRASSRGLLSKYDNSFLNGLLPRGLTQEKKEALLERIKKGGLIAENERVMSQACGGGKFTYASKPYQYPHYPSHAEARIIEELFARYPNGGGKLLMSIDWPTHPSTRTSRSPCVQCEALLCAASECMDIQFCDANNEPTKPDCP